MLQLSEPKDYPIPFFRLAFRPLFFGGMVFALVALLGWLLHINGYLEISPYGGALFWHAHEMLFGFVCAIIAGFLLTAVQNWTGIPGVSGPALIALWTLWLVPRVTAFIPALPKEVHALLDLSFLPVAAIFLARSVLAVRQYRNLFFVPILLLLTVANGLMHASVLGGNHSFFQQGYELSIWLITLVMTVLGGRVIPFFTANGTGTVKVPPIKILEILSVASLVVILLLSLTGLSKQLSPTLMAAVFLLAGLTQLWRCVRWKLHICFKVPLLWSLQGAYYFIPLGLLAMAALHLGWLSASPSTVIHFFTAGAMGAMILAMAARVTLGHTGRPLQPPRAMNLAFAAILAGGLLRTVGIILFPAATTLLLVISGLCWLVAFGLFCLYYGPMVFQARADGRRG